MPLKPKRKVDKKLLAAVRQVKCFACGSPPPNDAAHIRSKGAGGPDEGFNLMALCRGCHQRQHRLGFDRFLLAHPHVGVYLALQGWEMNEGKMWHPKLRTKE